MTKREREVLKRALDLMSKGFDEYAETLEDDSKFWEGWFKAEDLIYESVNRNKDVKNKG